MAVDLQTILVQWHQAGVFSIILPMLLLFAITFGILSATHVFGGNKQVHIIISLALALIAIASPDVQVFFQTILQNTGIALAIILVVALLTAMFIPNAHKGGWAIAFYCIGGICALFVVFNSFADYGYLGSQWWDTWGSSIIMTLLVIGVIIALSVSGPKAPAPAGGAPTPSFGRWWP